MQYAGQKYCVGCFSFADLLVSRKSSGANDKTVRKDNELEYVNIKNGTFGLWADTVVTPNTPNLTIRNCRIENMSAIGIMGQGTSIHASNTVLANWIAWMDRTV